MRYLFISSIRSNWFIGYTLLLNSITIMQQMAKKVYRQFQIYSLNYFFRVAKNDDSRVYNRKSELVLKKNYEN